MIEIDATGLHCPMPVLRLQKALRDLESGARMTLLASDPMAAIDVPHFLIKLLLKLNSITLNTS